MNKEQFLLTLQNCLAGMPRADMERTVQYYREMIDDRIEDGMTEAEAVADVGDPIELAEAILQKPVKQTAVKVPKAPKERKPMSAGKRTALIIVAALLIVAGVGIIFASVNTNWRKAMTKEYTFANSGIRSLVLQTGAAEVELLPAKDGVCTVRCAESAALKYKVWQNDDTLHIVREGAGRWALFPVSLKEDFVRVYLPEREYESLWVKSSSGGVGVSEDFRFHTAVIDASSGGVGFSADVTEQLDIQTSSGGVAVMNASPHELRITASSGGIALSDMRPGSVALHLSSGSMKLNGVHCTGDLSAESSSGSLRFSDVIAGGRMKLECTSGSIKLEDCDADALRIECTSGSVSGRLLTPKVYTASSVSGSVHVPAGTSGGLCEVKTTSGSIRFD